jgi:predicted GNAT family N-acyltransferase
MRTPNSIDDTVSLTTTSRMSLEPPKSPAERAAPEYDTFSQMEPDASGYRIKVVRDFEDMAKVFAIRASACFSDPEHLYAKHFDGNDFSSTHLIGFVDGEPVGSVRIRYFADFTRIERLTVRPTHRKSRISFKLAKAAFAWCRDKGYRKISGVAREELVPFWSMFGFRLTEGKDPIYIYGLPHFDMTLTCDVMPTAVTAMTDTMVLLRPEGRWHEAGQHEKINVTQPAGPAVEPRVMARRSRRPADVASKLGGNADRTPLSSPDNGELGAAPIAQNNGEGATQHQH